MSDDLFSPYVRVSDAEMTAAIAQAIRCGTSGQLSRAGDAFLATVAAEVVADRLALAGYIVLRRDGPGMDRGGALP